MSEEEAAQLRESEEELKTMLKESFSEEALSYMHQLDEEQLRAVLGWIAHDIIHAYTVIGVLAPRQGYAEDGKIDAHSVYNLALFTQVRGYDNEALLERKESGVPPSAQELLMGCYAEQIEEHTRDAVLTLRDKGYNTVESGFKNQLSGSQFFHITQEHPIEVPESLQNFLLEHYGVRTTITNKDTVRGLDSNIYFSSELDQPLNLEEWKQVLDVFANEMPTIGAPTFAKNGGTVEFVMEVMQNFPKEVLLETAHTEEEEELINALYACESREEVEELTGNSDWNVRALDD